MPSTPMLNGELLAYGRQFAPGRLRPPNPSQPVLVPGEEFGPISSGLVVVVVVLLLLVLVLVVVLAVLVLLLLVVVELDAVELTAVELAVLVGLLATELVVLVALGLEVVVVLDEADVVVVLVFTLSCLTRVNSTPRQLRRSAPAACLACLRCDLGCARGEILWLLWLLWQVERALSFAADRCARAGWTPKDACQAEGPASAMPMPSVSAIVVVIATIVEIAPDLEVCRCCLRIAAPPFRRLGDLGETPGFATPPRDGCAFVESAPVRASQVCWFPVLVLASTSCAGAPC
jgi:hypothetical protein